ncbi:MAG: Hemin transport system permease protein HmuU [Paracidovorax wautersii]|uniref:Hemin transport system permease protein HmuU n=1 Tax=Paracidovorax wautersii TaxID=1177982 RepID=A0A7V8FLZ0_9BURK|nr:MAG: Hemin transport system permease protein HmuU [Paracidovorax wautersii]
MTPPRHRLPPAVLALGLALLTLLLAGLGLLAGSLGLEPLSAGWALLRGQADPVAATVVWDIRLPRTLAAWLAGALLGMSGAIAQGVFRNPLADPYLLGSGAGANLGVALLLVALGLTPETAGLGLRLGLTGAAFVGSAAAVLLTVALARGQQQTLRLLLAGVVVSMVVGALASLVAMRHPQILQAMQAFMLGTTSYAAWPAVSVLAAAGVVVAVAAAALARVLDALALGERTARSLGLPLAGAGLALVALLALGTAAAVAQIGLVAFVGLVAPHLVRMAVRPGHAALVLLSGGMGGVLLLAADVLARTLVAPQELPVGVLTALLGGGYLLWMMRRRMA